MPWHPTPYPTDSAGRSFQVCYQAANTSCFPACLAMGRYYLTGRRPPEALTRFAVEVGANRSAGLAMRDWDQSITLFREIEGGIREARLGYTAHTAGKYFLTSRCAPDRPAICTVLWNGGGGHGVLCLGSVPNGTTILVLDPWYGLQEVRSANLPNYAPVGAVGSPGVTTTGAGRFDSQAHNYLLSRS
jgi:Papain-like cysteine protease AvrRpt2